MEVMAPQYFLTVKIKKGNKGKKERVLKQKPLKDLVIWFSNVYCLILECLEFKYFEVFLGLPTLKSISVSLPNLDLICATLQRKVMCLRYVLRGIFSYVLLLVMTSFFSSFLFYLSEICKYWCRRKNEIDIVL